MSKDIVVEYMQRLGQDGCSYRTKVLAGATNLLNLNHADKGRQKWRLKFFTNSIEMYKTFLMQ